MTVSREVTVLNPSGLHLRPASLIAETASRFTARIEIVKESLRVNARSILELATLVARQGDVLRLEADGADAELALQALEALFSSESFIQPSPKTEDQNSHGRSEPGRDG